MAPRFFATALMLGNVVTGVSVLAPTGMLPELSSGLMVTVRDAALLITFGAIVLCIASPLTAWLTSHFDRRLLLGGTLGVIAIGSALSALAPNYWTLMALRLVMLAIAALYTPQAAGTAALLTPPETRGSTISYVFLGWSLAAAVGLPLVTYVASQFGWRFAFGGLAAGAAVSAALVFWQLPRGLKGAPVDLQTWVQVARNPLIMLLLIITATQMSGQFVLLTFLGPLLKILTGAGPESVALAFAVYGGMGFTGNLIASRVVDRWGPYRTSLVFAAVLLAGVLLWSVGSGVYALMIMGMVLWGTGFASTNSMQQVRLVAAAPPMAGATVALNTSFLYIGQAAGSAIGSVLYGRDMLTEMGFVAAGLIALALTFVLVSRRLERKL